jgi:hypothetical protein
MFLRVEMIVCMRYEEIASFPLLIKGLGYLLPSTHGLCPFNAGTT